MTTQPGSLPLFTFNTKKMENILSNLWNILLQDPHLRNFLPVHPRVNYCRAPNFKNKIAPITLKSIPASLTTPVLIQLVDMHQCLKALWKTCKFVQHGKKSLITKRQNIPAKRIQLFLWLCSLCTYLPCRALRQRFGKHSHYIEGGEGPHSVRHFAEVHHESTNGLQVWVIEQMTRFLFVAKHFKKLCARETYWFNNLEVLSPGGSNYFLKIT